MRRKEKKPYIPIQTLLAYNATDKVVNLLEKHGVSVDPNDFGSLQTKLSELYKNSDDKLAIEKEMVDIHPHLGIFKRHYPSQSEVKQDKTTVDLSPIEKVNSEIKNTVIHDGYSNCEGSQTCSCMRALNFDGTGAPHKVVKNDSNINVIALVSIVAIFGIIVYKG